MNSIRTKLTLAFLGVALVTVGVLGLLVGRAASRAFESYLVARRTGDLGEMDRMMEEMMGAGASRTMIERMLGPAEQAYLAAVNNALWLAGGVAALVAVALSLLLARQISNPLKELTRAARQFESGNFEERVLVRGGDELAELAAAFNSMAEAVGNQQDLRRRMAADISHELRTPLAVIQAEIEAMLDGVRPLSTETVAGIHEEIRLLSRLITDLRDVSLAEAGRLLLHRGPEDLRALVCASAARFAPQADNKGVRLTVEAAEDLPRIYADPDRISQILGNLLENAVRHTLEGGAVTVRLGPVAGGNEVRVTVSDTGAGIPQEHLPNVFERFYRADGARSRGDGGSGIGLAVVRQLVEAHGGRVWAESPPGKGAVFGFVLPVTRRVNGGWVSSRSDR